MSVQVCSRCGHRKDLSDFPEQEDGAPPCCIACLVNGKAPSARKTRPLVMMPAVATKQCRRCQSVKPSDQFHCCRTHRDGLDTYCKICQAELSAERRTRQTRVVEITVTSKICRQCAEKKHVSAFNRNKNNPDGLASYCKPCRSQNEAGARSARRRRSQMASASASPSPSMRSLSPGKHGGSGNSSSPDVWPLQPEPGKMAMPPTPGSALRPLSAPLSRARTLGPPPDASATLPRIPGPGPWMPQSIVQLPRHFPGQLPGQRPRPQSAQADSETDLGPAGSRPLSAYAESEGGAHPDAAIEDGQWMEAHQPNGDEGQPPRQARGRARRPPPRHADYSRDGSPEGPDRDDDLQHQRPATQRGRSMLQQASRPLHPVLPAWGSAGLDSGPGSAPLQSDMSLGRTPSVEPPKRGLQPLGGRPVFGKSLRPFTAPASSHLGVNGHALNHSLAGSRPLSSSDPPSAQHSPSGRSPLGLPVSATPQSAGLGLPVGFYNHHSNNKRAAQLQLRGARVPLAAQQSLPGTRISPESFPGSTAHDLDAASALASISNSTSSFDPYPAGNPGPFRGGPRSHKPVGDLTIVGSPVKRQRTDGPPSVSRAVDWRPSPVKEKAGKDQPPIQTPSPFAPPPVRNESESRPVQEGLLPTTSGAHVHPASPPDPSDPTAEQQPAAHEGVVSDLPVSASQAAPRSLGHCASSSFRFWAGSSFQPLPAPTSQPAVFRPVDASLLEHSQPVASSGLGLPGAALQAGEGTHKMTGHPEAGLQTQKADSDVQTKLPAAEGSHPEHAVPADLNDSDASETSHSEPGLEPWSRPADGQAGPQPFATERPSKRQRKGLLARASAQPHAANHALDPSASAHLEPPSGSSLDGGAIRAADMDHTGEAVAEADADRRLLQRAHDPSASSPDGQLDRLEAILTCLKRPHLLHQPHGASTLQTSPGTNDTSHHVSPVAGPSIPGLTQAGAEPKAAQAGVPASSTGQNVAAADAARLATSAPTVVGDEALASAAMPMVADPAVMPHGLIPGLVSDPVPRPRRRSRPPAEVSAGDVSPKDTSLLAFFAAAAQQEGAEADGDRAHGEQAGQEMGEGEQLMPSAATTSWLAPQGRNAAEVSLGAEPPKHDQPQLPWDKPFSNQGPRKRRQSGLAQPGILTRAHSEDAVDWPFRWSGHRPRSGPIPRGMVF